MKAAATATVLLAGALVHASVPVVVHNGKLNWVRQQCGVGDLVTQWGATIDPTKAPILPEYPRPQSARSDSTWANLNGLWQYQPADASTPVPFGVTLNESILVPFPTESCLSGIGITHQWMYYRTVIDSPFPVGDGSHLLLQFGAVDWNTTVYVNGAAACYNTGGYNGFTCDVSNLMKATQNEIIVAVFDPSDSGAQPNGKQFIGRIVNPGGDTYTPSSGIWQTVWLEHVPATYISSVRILADMTSVTVTISASNGAATPVSAAIYDPNNRFVTNATGAAGTALTVNIPSPMLWHPNTPNLYTMSLQLCATGACDAVSSYFGMRSVSLGYYNTSGTPMTGPQPGIDRPGQDLPGYPVNLPQPDPNLCWAMCNQTAQCVAWAYGIPSCGGDPATPRCWLKSGHPGTSAQSCRVSGDQGSPPHTARRPLINGNFTFLAGWLDQSWWPDGQYVAPTDDALRSDLLAVKQFGLNVVRLHQKVNPERWYFHADQVGVAVLQDAVQKYGGATPETVPFFMHDIQAMVDGRYNHPCIIQWEAFNEGDCVGQFNATAVVDWLMAYDPSRLVDTNSGGPANNLYIADVNDIHSYPWPGHPQPSATQYAMIGEYGGLGAFVNGHEWVPNKCGAYMSLPTPQDELDTYVNMTRIIRGYNGDVSVVIYTQITDLELECDGFLNYDRTNKFNAAQMATMVAANQAMINGA